ncbi:MAG: immunity protein 19 [Fibrobacteres bacterium]|nr:immunity protein 19 [Fibrobacterota bacterium]
MSVQELESCWNNFWFYFLANMRGFDRKKELNLDEVLDEVVDKKQYIPDFEDWYETFLPEGEADEDGEFEQPNFLSEKLTDELDFAIEFHLSETRFYLNDLCIGNTGGHFEAWFISFTEFLAFERHCGHSLLLLPMVGIEKGERNQAKQYISAKLKGFPMFCEESDSLADCIVNGLLVAKPYSRLPDIGLTSSQNHCVRNVLKYPRHLDAVKAINIHLEKLMEVQ